jgi:hypothetical protein
MPAPQIPQTPQGQSGIVSPQNPTGAIYPITQEYQGTTPTYAQSAANSNPVNDKNAPNYNPGGAAPSGTTTTPSATPRYPSGYPTSYGPISAPPAQGGTPPTALEDAEQKYLNDSTVEDPTAIAKRIQDIYQQEINGVQAQYANLISGQEETNVNNLGRTRATAAASGTLGSSFGNAAMGTTEQYNEQQLETLQTEEQSALSDIYTKIGSQSETEYQNELSQRSAAEQQYIQYLGQQATQAQSQIAQIAATTPYDQLDQPTLDYLFKSSGFATPQQFQTYYNAATNAAKVGLKLYGNATTGYYSPSVDPTTGALNYNVVIPGIGTKLAPGQTQVDVTGKTIATGEDITKTIAPGAVLVDTTTGKVIDQGNAKIQAVPFMSSVVSTGGPAGTKGTTSTAGSATDKATAGDSSKGGAVASDSGNIYGLTASQVSSLNQAGVPKSVWGKVAAIVSGNQAPPATTGISANSAAAIAVSDGLQALGYDATKAGLDLLAMQTRLRSLNSTAQVRLQQAVNFSYDSLNIVQSLADAWSGGGFPILNNANLGLAASGVGVQELSKPVDIATTDPNTGETQNVHITDTQQLASLLQAQISDLTSELGTVYKGGNTSTDDSLSLAANNLKSDWSKDTLDQAINLAKTNLQIRKNSMAQSAVISGNPYSPSGTGSTTISPDLMTTLVGLGSSQGYDQASIQAALNAGYSASDLIQMFSTPDTNQ